MKKLILISALVLVCGTTARADDVYTVIVKKQADKKSKRWTIADWLSQKETMRAQDLWLSFHSPSPYEFLLGGDYQFTRSDPAVPGNHWRAFFAAYAYIFGLSATYESRNDTMTFLSSLRIFGAHAQSSNITAEGGVRYIPDAGFLNPLFGFNITIYIHKVFGFDLNYRHFFGSTTSAGTLSGDRAEAGAFIDFSFVRPTFSWFRLWEYQRTGGGLQRSVADAFTVGVKLFF